MQTATEKLREKCAQVGLELKDLTSILDVPKTSVDYYWSLGERSYKGEYLPTDKPWLLRLKDVLVDRGLSREEAEELFGMQRSEDLRAIRELLLKIDSKVDRISDDLERRIDSIERRVKPPDDKH